MQGRAKAPNRKEIEILFRFLPDSFNAECQTQIEEGRKTCAYSRLVRPQRQALCDFAALRAILFFLTQITLTLI